MSKQSATLILLITVVLFLILPSLARFSRPKCNPNDMKALLQIKEALNNPYDLQGWDSKYDCCHWPSLHCDPFTGRVDEIGIGSPEISGQMSPAVGDLPFLYILSFRRLNLTGTIPSSILKLKYLTDLTVSGTNISGPIPSFISRLQNLGYLDLSNNTLTGSIPPSLSELRNLTYLGLDRNKLTGSIPNSFGRWAGSTLDYINLSRNNLSGPVPRSFGNLTTRFYLSRNKLQGDPSFLFGKNRTIYGVDLSKNMFEFDISKVEFSESLKSLDLNHNKVFGSLPQGLTQLQLTQFNVSYNRLCGKIPQGGNLQTFDNTSYYHNRCLCGAPLPPCISS